MADNPYSSKFWKKSYDPHVKDRLDYPKGKTYTDLFFETVQTAPDSVAVNYMGRLISFGELDTLSNRFANFLLKQGMKPGEVVGVYSFNGAAFYIAVPGIIKTGCIVSGVSPLLTPRELEIQLTDSGANILVALDMLWGNIGQVIEKTKVKAVVLTAMTDFLPVEKPLNLPSTSVPVFSFTDLMQQMPADPVMVRVEDQATFLMPFTGGTTGPAKGAEITHRNMVRHIMQYTNYADVKAYQHRMLTPFPLFHMAGLWLNLLAMGTGMPQYAIPNPRDYDSIIAGIKRHKPTIMTAVPTMWLDLMKKPEFQELDFSDLVMAVSGAAPFPVEYYRDLEKIVGEGKLTEGLAMTEASPTIAVNPRYGKHKAGSVGLPITDTEVMIVDTESKKPVPIGEPGELAVKGPQVMKGYYNKLEETANTLRDGWLYTGDICKMDEDGYLFVVDRLKDMVNVSGYKVFTKELDEIIGQHSDVSLVSSVGLSDPVRPGAEIVASAIVLKPGIEKSEAEKEKIREFIRKKEAPYKVPKIVEFVDQLPVSSVGKILKREIKEMLTEILKTTD